MGADDIVRRAHDRKNQQEQADAERAASAIAYIAENKAEVARYLNQIKSAALQLAPKAENLLTALTLTITRKRALGRHSYKTTEVPSAGWLLLTWQAYKGISDGGYDAREVPVTKYLYLLIDGRWAVGYRHKSLGDNEHNESATPTQVMEPTDEGLLKICLNDSSNRDFGRLDTLIGKAEDIFAEGEMVPAQRPRIKRSSFPTLGERLQAGRRRAAEEDQR